MARCGYVFFSLSFIRNAGWYEMKSKISETDFVFQAHISSFHAQFFSKQLNETIYCFEKKKT